VYYQLYADNDDIPSKVAFDPEEPSVGRIRTDSVAPPHSLASVKRHISIVEETPALAHAHLFADILCDTPLKDISILDTNGPGQSPNEPMAIVQVASPSIPDGRYFIKNRAANFFWYAGYSPIRTVYFLSGTMEQVKSSYYCKLENVQVNEHSPTIHLEVFKR
jgi:hypothetical protein